MALQIYGQIPDYVVKSLNTDGTGILTGIAGRYFKVGPKNQRINPAWLRKEFAPDPFGVPFTTASSTVGKGICAVVYQFQGLDDAWVFDEDQVTFELDTSFSEDPIETHPYFKELAKIYAWNKTEHKFAEFLANVIGSGSALSRDRKKTNENPLFGTEGYLAIGAVFKRSYAAREVPNSLLDDLGEVVKRPPDIGRFKLPTEFKKRNWLKMGPTIMQKGSAIQISDSWMLSGPKGWLEQVYGKVPMGGR